MTGHRPHGSRSAGMTDFASAAMVRVLAQGMRTLGLDPGPSASTDGSARVHLQLKLDLVRSAVLQGGLGCLPLLGRGLHRLAHEPTHAALASARHAGDLFERWQRLERYIHARHRCTIVACGADVAQIRHIAVGGGAAPSAAEDLVVAGVLAALLEAIGMHQVRAWAGGARAYPAPDADAITSAAAQGATAAWRFTWDSTAPASPPVTRAAPDALELGADPAWPDATRAAYLQLVADLARPLPLSELAQALGMPRRTLQRRLGDGGLSYVGFLSGFADQSHFTRELQQRVGMPPAAYRAAFASTGNGLPNVG